MMAPFRAPTARWAVLVVPLFVATAGESAARRPTQVLPSTAEAVVATPSVPGVSRPPADLPPDHWSYPLLERLVARRILDLDLSTRPLARSEVTRALAERLRAPSRNGSTATEREAWALDVLGAEFLGLSVDRPVLSRKDGDAVVALGVSLGSELLFSDSVPGDDVRASGDVAYELWGGVGERAGFWSSATVLIEEQDGPRMVRLSSRAKTWRGVAATVDEAYFKLEGERTWLALGRRAPQWGTARWGRLLISGTAATLDEMEGGFRVGPLTFHALHAVLEYEETGGGELAASDHVFLGAHRATFRWPSGSVAVSEAVVYSATIPEPGYLIPLVPYYLSQHNEREDDNVLWSLDVVSRPAAGLELSAEFLADDLQYERETAYPDKYGVTVGAAHFGSVAGRDVETILEYTNVRPWTYTHGRVEHRFAQDGDPIGFDLGPDADRVTLTITVHPWVRWSARASFSNARKGEGTLTEAFVPGEEDAPAFPSGTVTTARRVSLSLHYDDAWRFSSWLRVSHWDSEGGDSGDGGWELRAGAGFRI